MTTRTGILSSAPMSAFAFIPLSSIPHDGKILEGANKLNFSSDPGTSAGMQRAFQMQKEWLINSDVSFLEYVPRSDYLH